MRRNIQIEDIGVMTAPRMAKLPRATAPTATPPVEPAPTAPSRLPEIAPRAPGRASAKWVPGPERSAPAPAPTAPAPTPPTLPPPPPSAQEVEAVSITAQMIQTAPVSQVPIKAPVVGVPAPRPIGTAKGGAPGVLKKSAPPPPMAVSSEATAAPEPEPPRSRVGLAVGAAVAVIGGFFLWRRYSKAK